MYAAAVALTSTLANVENTTKAGDARGQVIDTSMSPEILLPDTLSLGEAINGKGLLRVWAFCGEQKSLAESLMVNTEGEGGFSVIDGQMSSFAVPVAGGFAKLKLANCCSAMHSVVGA